MNSLNLRCCGVPSEIYLMFSPEKQMISPKPTSSYSKRSFFPTLTIPYSPWPLAKHLIWKGFSVSSSMKTWAHERRVLELMMTALPLVRPITQTQFGKTLLMKKLSVFSSHSNFPSLYISITLFAGFFCSLCERWAKWVPPKCILDLFRKRTKFLGLLLRTVLRSWVTSRRSCTQSCLEYCTIFLISLKWILWVCSASLMSCS